MILAGDIGGTKTVLTLIEKQQDGTLVTVDEQTFASGNFQTFDEILALFLGDRKSIGTACFGVAGPVIKQRCQTTNLPWILDAAQLKIALGTNKVKLLNDLEAMAIGMLHLQPEDFVELNPNAEPQTGNIAVIAAGTGLGEAILYWDGQRYLPIATEGGHTDFAPVNDTQQKLLGHLHHEYPEHVSYERILSGIGFGHIYDFLYSHNFAAPCLDVPSRDEAESDKKDRNAIISQLGVYAQDPLCKEVVRLFVEIYGGEAGNLALKSFATGGVFIGGGIAPKIRTVMESGVFLEAFISKGRFKGMLSKVSVKLALNPNTPLLGAIHYFGE